MQLEIRGCLSLKNNNKLSKKVFNILLTINLFDIYKAFAIMFFVIKQKPHLSQYFLSGNGKLTYWKLPGRLTYEYEVKVSRCDFHKDKRKVINMARTSLMLSLPANGTIIFII